MVVEEVVVCLFVCLFVGRGSGSEGSGRKGVEEKVKPDSIAIDIVGFEVHCQ